MFESQRKVLIKKTLIPSIAFLAENMFENTNLFEVPCNKYQRSIQTKKWRK